jgi:hypothetical protein
MERQWKSVRQISVWVLHKRQLSKLFTSIIFTLRHVCCRLKDAEKEVLTLAVSPVSQSFPHSFEPKLAVSPL